MLSLYTMHIRAFIFLRRVSSLSAVATFLLHARADRDGAMQHKATSDGHAGRLASDSAATPRFLL